MKNVDKFIRNVTDEELAAFLAIQGASVLKNAYKKMETPFDFNKTVEIARNEWIEWFEQDAE